METVDSFLEFATKKVDSDFLLFLGDSPAHNTWQQEKKDHLRGLKEVSSKFQQMYDKPVYPLLGNHEGYPSNQFDINEKTNNTQWVIDETVKTWDKWLTKEMKEEFLRNGCYSTLYKSTKLRIIQITPFVQMAVNFYLWGNQTDPLGVLSWLENELKRSEKRGESVLIIAHLPPFHPPFNPCNVLCIIDPNRLG